MAVVLAVSFSASSWAADPGYSRQAKIAAPDGERYDLFGQSVAMTGSTVVVGAPNHGVGEQNPTGALYVYVKPGGGWSDLSRPTAVLSGADPTLNLGAHVAVSGSTIVATAYVGPGRRPAVLVFVRPRTGWTDSNHPTAVLVHRRTPADDRFGTSVAVSGDAVAVGALGYASGSDRVPGTAYLYNRPAAGWSGTRLPDARLRPRDVDPNKEFGFSVAMSSGVLAVGAPHWRFGGHERGAVFVFRRPSSGWTTSHHQQATLAAANGRRHDQFGYAIALHRGLVAVGAPYRGIRSCTYADQGAGYAFTKPRGGWSGSLTESAYLTTHACEYPIMLGWSIAASGSTIALGAPNRPFHNTSQQGGIYLFTKPATGWAQHLRDPALYVDRNGAVTDRLGVSVAVADRTVLGGAPHPGDGVYASTQAPGKAYVLEPS